MNGNFYLCVALVMRAVSLIDYNRIADINHNNVLKMNIRCNAFQRSRPSFQPYSIHCINKSKNDPTRWFSVKAKMVQRDEWPSGASVEGAKACNRWSKRLIEQIYASELSMIACRRSNCEFESPDVWMLMCTMIQCLRNSSGAWWLSMCKAKVSNEWA